MSMMLDKIVAGVRRCRCGPAVVLGLACMLAGCANTTDGLQKMSDGALQVVGLKAPDASADAAAPRALTIRVVAGTNLNADRRGRPISLVLRMYALREAAAFARTPYEHFLDRTREAAALGGDLVESKELVLSPGKQFTLTERLPAEAKYFAVVGQFLEPAPERWRFVFPVQDNAKHGILIGAHACALTVSQGVLALQPVPDPGSLNAVRCRKT